MTRPVRVLVVGVGAMGRLCTRFLLEKGAVVTGAVSRQSHVGEDLGPVCGLGRDLGVIIGDDLEAAIAGSQADVAVVCVATFVGDMVDIVAPLLRAGIDVVTTSEELFYSWRTQPVLTADLDAAGRRSGATLVGSGYNDYFWGGEVFQLAGACQDVRLIQGLAQFNIDDYGPQVALNSHVGETVEEFGRAFAGEQPPSFLQPVADLLCAHLGLTATVVEETIRPAVEDTELPCVALGTTIPAGRVTGKITTVAVETGQGAALHLELRERLYLPGETDLNRWTVRGEPEVTVENPAPATDVLTCSTIVNRIPDVLAAPPGYVTVDRLPPLRFRRELTVDEAER
jgi:hypothetical protein